MKVIRKLINAISKSIANTVLNAMRDRSVWAVVKVSTIDLITMSLVSTIALTVGISIILGITQVLTSKIMFYILIISLIIAIVHSIIAAVQLLTLFRRSKKNDTKK